MIKIIFLDIDGVICTHRACLSNPDTGIFRKWDPIAIDMINYLCDQSGAKIVVSSSWRKDTNNLQMTLAVGGLHQRHFYHDHDYDIEPNKEDQYGFMTPKYVFNQEIRGDQVQHWLDKRKHLIDTYIILDDNTDFHDYQKNQLVITDCYNGMSFENFQKAKELLGIV